MATAVVARSISPGLDAVVNKAKYPFATVLFQKQKLYMNLSSTSQTLKLL